MTDISVMTELPPRSVDCQYVLVWVYGGKIWSATYKHEEGVLYEYDLSSDSWCIISPAVLDGLMSFDKSLVILKQ